MNSLNEISKIINEKDDFSILIHYSVDGDCLGAAIALATALKKMGKKVSIFIDTALPEYFEFLPNKSFLVEYKGLQVVGSTCIALDCGDKTRFNDRINVFDKAETTINIDHHKTNVMFADYNYVEPNCSSTCEIVFRLLKELECEIDLDIANALYAGIASDTGGFKYSNTCAETHLTVAELINSGVNVGKLSERIFMYSTMKELKTQAKALENLSLHCRGLVALTTISYDEIKEVNAELNDLEGLADFGREIPTVSISAAAKEVEPGKIRFSIRSKGQCDVAKIAEVFEGGGHINAAGCTINDTLDNAVQKFLREAEKIV